MVTRRRRPLPECRHAGATCQLAASQTRNRRGFQGCNRCLASLGGWRVVEPRSGKRLQARPTSDKCWMFLCSSPRGPVMAAIISLGAVASGDKTGSCTPLKSLGCLGENGHAHGFQGSCPTNGGPCGRCLPYFVGGRWNALTSRENCACLCHRAGFAVAGVENGANCYCARDAASYNATDPHHQHLPILCGGHLPAGRCVAQCDANRSEVCGGPGAVDVFTFMCPESCTLPPPPKPGPVPPPPAPAPGLPPAYYRPRFHYTPAYRYGAGPGDTSGAVYSEKTKTYHIFPLVAGGVEHASSSDLVHWTELGRTHSRNLDDSGGVVISNGTAVALSAGGLRAMISLATDDALLNWGEMKTLFSAQAWNNRHGAMAFPGDPLAPWQDPRDPTGRWYIGLAIDGCHNNSGRLPADGYGCPKGGAEQLWSSPALFGPQAEWVRLHCLNDAPCPPLTSHGASIMLQYRLSGCGSMLLCHLMISSRIRSTNPHGVARRHRSLCQVSDLMESSCRRIARPSAVAALVASGFPSTPNLSRLTFSSLAACPVHPVPARVSL
jgi:hypothetical protein